MRRSERPYAASGRPPTADVRTTRDVPVTLTDAPTPHLQAVCAGELEVVGTGRSAHRSGIRKRPLAGGVHVDERGVPGDHIGDVEDHGGIDQALYAYAVEDATWWAEELGRELPAGSFGENLRTVGIDPTAARIGDRWRLGDEVEVVVTGPRIPCATLAAAWDERGIVDRFLRAGRLGAYLRVTRPGPLVAGDPLAPRGSAPPGTLTVGEVAVILTRQRHRASELLDLPALAHRVRDWAAEATTARG